MFELIAQRDDFNFYDRKALVILIFSFVLI